MSTIPASGANLRPRALADLLVRVVLGGNRHRRAVPCVRQRWRHRTGADEVADGLPDLQIGDAQVTRSAGGPRETQHALLSGRPLALEPAQRVDVLPEP